MLSLDNSQGKRQNQTLSFTFLTPHPSPLNIPTPTPNDACQQALTILIASFVTQRHPPEYAQHMATAAVFQAGSELRNAQLTHLLSWLKQEHSDICHEAVLK